MNIGPANGGAGGFACPQSSGHHSRSQPERPRIRWLLPQIDPASAGSLARALGIQPPAARVLAARGYADPEHARRFLRPTLDDLHDPFLLLGMKEAVERMHRAIAGGENILLYGDYDVDGTTSVVILKKAIEMLGGQAWFHVPHRIREGYGMQAGVVEQAAADGVKLLLSVDTGIRSASTVARARELGIDVIVTDHHLPDAELPPALAVLNPNRPGCAYPEKNLCGVGVAFKLAQALFERHGWPLEKQRRVAESLLKLVAIGTVADVVPLTGENRVLVKFGLAGLRSVRNPGLRALLDVSGFAEGDAPSAGQVAFRIAPRMNAAGRMADAIDVINLFLTEDPEEARALAARLHALNQERQQAEAAIVQAILAECERVPVTGGQMALVFAGENWHRGVVGIVASRVVEQYHRPAIVLSLDPEEGVAHGSGRSIPAFHLLEALESMPGLFLRFGGHKQAAGLALPADRIEEFRRRLNEYAAARLTADDIVPEIELDACLDFREINEKSVAEVLSLAPFGFGNPAPLFAALGVEVAAEPAVWKEKHLRVGLRQNGRTVFAKAWNFTGRAADLRPGARVDVAVALEEDPYALGRGNGGWSVALKDVRPVR
jgi:single-stranded-DNA-specific exonuclease